MDKPVVALPADGGNPDNLWSPGARTLGGAGHQIIPRTVRRRNSGKINKEEK